MPTSLSLTLRVIERILGDGEVTAGIIDTEGRFTKNPGVPAYVMAPEVYTINTDCYLITEDDGIEGIRNPGVKVC